MEVLSILADHGSEIKILLALFLIHEIICPWFQRFIHRRWRHHHYHHHHPVCASSSPRSTQAEKEDHDNEHQGSSSQKDGKAFVTPCPKRCARFFKCEKRRQRLLRDNTHDHDEVDVSEEAEQSTALSSSPQRDHVAAPSKKTNPCLMQECPLTLTWACCQQVCKLYKMHLPPPLPLVKRNDKNKTKKTHQQPYEDEDYGDASTCALDEDDEILQDAPEVQNQPMHMDIDSIDSSCSSLQGLRSSSLSTTSSSSPPSERDSFSSVESLEGQDSLVHADFSSFPALAAPVAPASIFERTSLMNLTRMQQWSEILGESPNRKQAKHRDTDGLYPIHWACSGGAPKEVVEWLLEAYPSAARKTDREGSTPLHFATHYSASIGVVDTLLKAYPKAIRMQDKYGRSPLYHAVDKGSSLDVFKSLVRADPSMITASCDMAVTKTHDNSQNQSSKLTRIQAVQTPLYMVWVEVLVDRQARLQRRGKKWEKAMLLTEAAFRYEFTSSSSPSSSSSSTAFRLVTAAIMLDLFLPEPVLNLAVETYPEQVQEADPSTGQYPLALAAGLGDGTTNPTLTPTSYGFASFERWEAVMDLLLGASPAAAHELDTQGRSVFGLALSSNRYYGGGWTPLLQRLLRAEPEAIARRDGVTGLPPALTAAVGTAAINNNDDNNKKEEDLNLDPFHLVSRKHREWMMQQRMRSHWFDMPVHHNNKKKNQANGNNDDIVSPETNQLDTIYELLQAHPLVVSSA